MTYLHLFLTSLKLPKKNAMFKLNRAGMDVAVIYMFLMLAIVSIPSLIERLTATTGLGADLHIIFKLIYFFMFYYLPMTILVFAALSIVAYMGVGFAMITQRKLRFAILWKLSAFTTTIPFLLYTVITLLFHVSDLYLAIAFLYAFILLIKMITIYPQKRTTHKK
ncbi:hypothetical protein [Oceanobacillus massiliensis]|uniref:hypothetical protein n=1 Tax=Oceanobacillus massiliensis TaxID=1465765 RepID=UPI000289027F|nr:hypothetical protein [Oceanobacillus massiliensis]